MIFFSHTTPPKTNISQGKQSVNPSVAPLFPFMGTPGPRGSLGAHLGLPKHDRNLGPMPFLARIALLFLICVQIAPVLCATPFSEQIEKDIVIERDLADLCSQYYFISVCTYTHVLISAAMNH